MVSRLILIGFMGSGKTTLGRKLAKKLNYQFIDTDTLIEEQEQLSISQIFDQKGESYFRAVETKLLDSLENHENTIISVGGGLPCFEKNMEKLKQLGTVIYLERPAKELYQRILTNIQQRPLLANKTESELLNYIEKTLQDRDVYYRQAHFILNRDQQKISDLQAIVLEN